MVRIWTKSAVSASSYTSTAFLSTAAPTLNSVMSDASKVFLSGSLTDSSDTSAQLFNLDKGSSNTPAFILQLPYRSRITEILVIAQGSDLNDYRVTVSDTRFVNNLSVSMNGAT